MNLRSSMVVGSCWYLFFYLRPSPVTQPGATTIWRNLISMNPGMTRILRHTMLNGVHHNTLWSELRISDIWLRSLAANNLNNLGWVWLKRLDSLSYNLSALALLYSLWKEGCTLVHSNASPKDDTAFYLYDCPTCTWHRLILSSPDDRKFTNSRWNWFNHQW